MKRTSTARYGFLHIRALTALFVVQLASRFANPGLEILAGTQGEAAKAGP